MSQTCDICPAPAVATAVYDIPERAIFDVCPEHGAAALMGGAVVTAYA